MRFDTHVETPREEPEIPPRMLDYIEEFIDGIHRIDLLCQDDGRWVKVNALHVDRAYSRDEALLLARLVKSCADAHATERAQSGKYRAMIRRHVGPERERRVMTFTAETRLDRRRRERMARYEDKPRSAFWAGMILLETVVDLNLRAQDRLIRQQRTLDQIQHRMLDELTVLLHLYYQGLQMQEEVIRERAELQMQDALAAMQAKSTATAWAAFGPMIEGLVEHVGRVARSAREQCDRDGKSDEKRQTARIGEDTVSRSAETEEESVKMLRGR